MATRSKAAPQAVFELRSASVTLIVFALKTTDMAAIEAELAARFADTPEMFSHDPVLIDLAQAEGDPLALDYAALAAMLRRFNMVAAALRGGSPEQMAAALAAGLGEAPEAAPALRTPVVEALPEPVAELPPPPPPVEAPAPEPTVATLIVDKPLRSGQQVYARGGDLVVLAAVNFGAEVIADGSIHVTRRCVARQLRGPGATPRRASSAPAWNPN